VFRRPQSANHPEEPGGSVQWLFLAKTIRQITKPESPPSAVFVSGPSDGSLIGHPDRDMAEGITGSPSEDHRMEVKVRSVSWPALRLRGR
jgi:hypothetical protein